MTAKDPMISMLVLHLLQVVLERPPSSHHEHDSLLV